MESAKYAAVKKVLIVCGMIPGIFMLFTALLIGLGEEGHFIDKCVIFCIPAGIVLVILVGVGVIVYYNYRVSCSVQQYNDGSIDITITGANGTPQRAHGFWTCHAVYTKSYHKYGAYHKHLHLILFCNDVIFGVFRHEVAPAFSPPAGFQEINSEPSVIAPAYFTDKTEEIFRMVQASIQLRFTIPAQ
jgi:hypothetical protein